MIECSLEVFQARYGSDDRYRARLARRFIRSEAKGDREIWVLVYGAVEPYIEILEGESRRPRRKRFKTRHAAEEWASKLLGIPPDRWEGDDVPETVH